MERLIYVLRSINLPVLHRKAIWSVSRWTGSLLCKKAPLTNIPDRKLPNKLISAIEFCNNPYKCISQSHGLDIQMVYDPMLDRMHKRLLAIGNHRFFLSVIYASFSWPLFNTTREAFSAISLLPDQKNNRTKLCLQRSLLAAKTSRSFRNAGVLFVGAHLDTFDMHAWIIENSEQPDIEDRTWINYQPLLAFIKS